MIDVTDDTFETEVLERSRLTPVVVDLWAPWCGPCKTLGPMIEKVIDETGGRVILAKINVDENPGASQAFRVQSIPAVYAVVGGQISDGFTGAQPESAIREFVDKLIPPLDASAIEALVARGDESSLLQVLDIDRDHEAANLALAGLWIENGRGADALELLERIPENDEARQLEAAARAVVEAVNKESEALEGRLAELLPQVKADDAARVEFLELLEKLGPENEATVKWRKKLTNQLF